MNSQIVTVNLTPGLSAPAVVRVSQYDAGRPILFKVLDGMTPASFVSGTVATITGTKPSGLGFSVTGTISGNTVTLDSTIAMTQECGMIPAEIRFSITNGPNIGTANFILAVEKTPHAEGTTDGTQETMANLETRLQAEIDDLSDRIDDIEAGGSGLSSTEKQLILTLFSKAAYAENDAGTAYNTLENLWTTTTRTITYTLSHVTSSNTTASIESGQSYTTTLTAASNYTLNTVSVTMGGVDITSTAYSSGTVSIASVTGNIVITATAVLSATSITATYTQSGTVYDTDSLDSLKTDLVVTANYAGGTSETVPSSDYTLSGTLEVGTSTITVSYVGLTTTFNVTVTGLPDEYTRLMYVTANGNQYVNTNISEAEAAYAEYEVLITSQPTVNGLHILSSANTYFPFLKGASAGSSNWRDSLAGKFKGNETFENSGGSVSPYAWNLNQKYKLSGYPSVKINGTECDRLTAGATSSVTNMLYLFTYGGTPTNITYRFYGNLYNAKIYDSNGVLLRNFVPAKNSSDVAGLYDLVSGTFFTSGTSTALIAGEEA